MFYCDPCATERSYPETMFKSHGRCEVCGALTVCNERPSSMLPKPCNWSGLGRCKRPLGHEGAHQIVMNDAETAHLLDVGMGWDRQRDAADLS